MLRICRNELDSDVACYGAGIVPDVVYVVTTRVDKRHPLLVDSGLAGGIGAFVIGQRSRRDLPIRRAETRVPAGRDAS